MTEEIDQFIPTHININDFNITESLNHRPQKRHIQTHETSQKTSLSSRQSKTRD